jgi:hypothetical protein
MQDLVAVLGLHARLQHGHSPLGGLQLGEQLFSTSKIFA